MVSSSSTNTPQRAGRSAFLLVGLVAGFLAVITFLPRVVLMASGSANTRMRQATQPSVPADERYATLAHVERLLQSGTPREIKEAGRLMDGITNAPLLISECDSMGDSESDASFSSSILIAKLGRQFDAAAVRSIGSMTPESEKNALQWTQRARLLADALMLSPHPSFSALKVAHYLDSIAGKREASVLKACGNVTAAATAEHQNKLLTQLWNTEILPTLERIKLEQYESEQAATKTNRNYALLTDADWLAQVDTLALLYQRQRPFMSQA